MNQPLFPSLPEQWTPILRASDLGDKPIKVQVAGTSVALFRSHGQVSALLDRCPHRGVSLSLGKVEDGCLVCPFHGWEFQGDGACRHVPLNPDVNRSKLGATAIPVRERGGLIWLFTGLRTETEPFVPDAMTTPGFTRFIYVEDWDAHWTCHRHPEGDPLSPAEVIHPLLCITRTFGAALAAPSVPVIPSRSR